MARNHYQLSQLKKRDGCPIADRSAVFFGIRRLATGQHPASPSISHRASLDELGPWLRHDLYFVAHDLVVAKGKACYFTGALEVAARDDLLAFLHAALAQDDLRPLLVSPIFDAEPELAFRIRDDGSFDRVAHPER